MTSITIDPGLFVSPAVEATPAEVRTYIRTLLRWCSMLRQSWLSLYMSEQAADALVKDNFFPLHKPIEQLLDQKGITEYDANTVVGAVYSLLLTDPSLETFLRIQDVLPSDVETEPDVLAINQSRHLAAELSRCVVLLAILGRCSNAHADHVLVVRPHSTEPLVKVQAVIHDIQHQRDDISWLPMAPEIFTGAIMVCHDFQDLLLSIDENSLWQRAADEGSATLALQLALFKSRIERGQSPQWEQMPPFLLGREFLSTARRCCSCNPPSLVAAVLRSMVETVDNLNLADTHRLREGSGANTAQRRRGNDAAWRRDINHEFHLHYWIREDGQAEFASVVPHNDFSIPI